MKNKKHIIIDPKEGIFLGTMKNHPHEEFASRDPDDKRLIALFSSNNLLDITKAVAFKDKYDAAKYMSIYIKPQYPDSFVAEIEDNKSGMYVDTIDIVKSGYGDYAWEMIDALPMPSQLDH